MIRRLSNPFCDKTCRPLSADEAGILLRLLAGETLVCASLADAPIAWPVYWCWGALGVSTGPQRDWPVIRLLARQAIRPVQIVSGYAEMVLTPAGRAKAKGLKRKGAKK